MPDILNDTLREWQNFYFMTGGAAAALIGLMFVAMSLGMHLVSEVSAASFQHFVTPGIVYFTSALLLACVMLAPGYSATALALLTTVGGAVGLIRTALYVRYLIEAAREYADFDIAEWLGQVIVPLLSYGLIVVGGILLAVDQMVLAFRVWWLAMILLLLCGIRNTWSIVIWIIDRHKA